jgi:hypothetical protein
MRDDRDLADLAGAAPPRKSFAPVLAFDIVVLVVVALLLSALFWPAPARAHSWYPQDCCSDRDCWPMGTDADAREPDPTPEKGGWVTHDGKFVPESETRPSKDGRFHICRSDGTLTGEVIWPSRAPFCLFVPRPSS